MDDKFRKLIETQETMRRQIEPLLTIEKIIAKNAEIQSLIEAQNRARELMRTVFGPIEDLRSIIAENTKIQQFIEEGNRVRELMQTAASPIEGFRLSDVVSSALHLQDEFQQLQNMSAEFEKSFRLPGMAEAINLFHEFESKNFRTTLNQYQQEASELQHAMKAMSTPWMDIRDKFSSINGFAEVQGIGHALRTTPPFDTHLTDALRRDLGDWRDKIRWPADIFTDPIARTSFYADRGLNPSLTAFPASAFEQSITIAGLKGFPPPLIEAYKLELETENNNETAFERTNKAHDWFQRFESQLRQYIDEQMKKAFGENWAKHQVPGVIYKAWIEKRHKALENGESERPLIAYADFTDYVPIIVRKDNWQVVFESVFRRSIFIQESFQRLYPIRICTMHSRLITQDDELYLYVEIKRILKAISTSEPSSTGPSGEGQ